MTVGRWLLLLGFVCLTIMILTHVAQGLHLVPGMGWGLPDSPVTSSILPVPYLAVRL